MTTGLGRNLDSVVDDIEREYGISDEKEVEHTITPEQEAEGKEFLARLGASAIKDPVSGQDVIPDMVLISQFHSWLYKNELWYTDELTIIIERSWKWVEERRKYEAQIGILQGETLCWLYSREQIHKIEANPTDESLYGLVILPSKRQKAIAESKKYHDYISKSESGYFERLAAESLRKDRGEVAQSQRQFKEAEF